MAGIAQHLAGLAFLDDDAVLEDHDAVADLATAEAVLIPDTALPSLELIDRLEAACRRPVLTANQVTIWAGLGLATRPLIVVGYGRLFTLPAPGGPQ